MGLHLALTFSFVNLRLSHFWSLLSVLACHLKRDTILGVLVSVLAVSVWVCFVQRLTVSCMVNV